MRRIASLLLFAISCAHHEPPPAPRVPAPVVVPPPPAPVAPRPRLDRPATRLGGPLTWATAESVGALRFCPGDDELLAVESTGGVRRYRASDGAQLAVTQLAGAAAQGRWSASVDCRADGTAVTLDGELSPVLIDRAGALTRPPAPIEGQRAQFAADGSVWVLTSNAGVVAWHGDAIDTVIAARPHVLYEGLGEGGVYVAYIYNSGTPAEDGTWMTRNGTRIKLSGRAADITQVSVAPDGGLAIADEMAAYAWVLQGKVTGPRTLLLDQSGTHINAIAATNRWFIVVDAGSNLWDAIRPSMRWDHLDKPCGEHNILTAIAVAHDDKRIALACTGVGIRIVDLESGRQLSKDAPNTAADELVWSPDGHRLATRSDGAIRVWRGPLLVTSIPEPGGGGLWWDSASAVGGELYGELAEWSVPEGVKHPDRVELRSERTARSPHGEIIAASRVMSGTVDQVTILRGDRRDTFDLPDTKIDWIDGLAISDSGAHAVLWRGQYNGKPGTEVIAIDVATHAIQLATGTITAAAIDDATLVTASAGGELVRRAGGAAKKLGDHGGDVTALAIRGDLVTAGGTDGTISVWSLARGALGTLRGHTAAIRALAISSDGTHLASTAADGTLTWDLSP